MGIIDSLYNVGKDIVNWGAAKEQQQYDRSLQQTIFNREDNAIQRRVGDLKAAGLSPILAAGSAAGAGAVVKSEAPQAKGTVTDSVADALALMQMKTNIAQSEAQIELTKAQTAKAASESDFNLKSMADRVAMQSSLLKGQDLANINASLESELKRNGITKAQLDIIGKRFENAWAEQNLTTQQREIAIKNMIIEYANKTGLPPGTAGDKIIQYGAVLANQLTNKGSVLQSGLSTLGNNINKGVDNFGKQLSGEFQGAVKGLQHKLNPGKGVSGRSH